MLDLIREPKKGNLLLQRKAKALKRPNQDLGQRLAIVKLKAALETNGSKGTSRPLQENLQNLSCIQTHRGLEECQLNVTHGPNCKPQL